MSTLTRGTVPVTLVIGRPWRHVLTLCGPPPGSTPMNLTGMGIAALLTGDGLYGGALNLAPQIARDDPNGAVTLTLDAQATALVPDGRLSALRVTFTGTDGQTHDFVEPVEGLRP